MSDTTLRDLVLKRLDADTRPEDEWSALVLAALEGPDELAKLLDEQAPEPPKPPSLPAPSAEVALAIVTIVFNIQKWVIIAATAIMGAATIFGTILLLFNPAASVLENPVRSLLASSPFAILALAVAGLGIYFQFVSTRSVTVVEYNRMSEMGA